MKLKKKEFEELKKGSMSVSEYVTRFTQLSRYTPDNVDTNEKKQDWFLNGLNDVLAYALEARDFVNFQDMVDNALVLKTEGELWNERERCSALDCKEATLGSVLVHCHEDMCSILCSRVHNQECKLRAKYFKRPRNDKFSAPNSSLLILHRRHRRGAIMYKTLVLWDHVSVVVRVGTTLIGVQGSRPFRCQPQAQIRTSIAVPTTMHLLWQGRTKLVLV
jgi:hypothetical protein